MTLDITFYKENTDPESEAAIALSEEFYEKLAKSDFAEIGKTLKKKIKIDFLQEEIVEETKIMLEKLGDSPSKEEYNQHSSDLRKLHEILKHLEYSQYHYLAKTP